MLSKRVKKKKKKAQRCFKVKHRITSFDAPNMLALRKYRFSKIVFFMRMSHAIRPQECPFKVWSISPGHSHTCCIKKLRLRYITFVLCICMYENKTEINQIHAVFNWHDILMILIIYNMYLIIYHIIVNTFKTGDI